MTQSLTIARDIPKPTPEVAKSLSPQELEEHRNRIGADVRVVLSAYFQPNEADEVRAAQLAWWCDELEDWSHEQVVWALRKWNREKPRLRPTPGDIVSILKVERGKAWAKRQVPETPATRSEPTAEERERANAIIAEAGFNVRRMGETT